MVSMYKTEGQLKIREKGYFFSQGNADMLISPPLSR